MADSSRTPGIPTGSLRAPRTVGRAQLQRAPDNRLTFHLRSPPFSADGYPRVARRSEDKDYGRLSRGCVMTKGARQACRLVGVAANRSILQVKVGIVVAATRRGRADETEHAGNRRVERSPGR